MQCVRHELEEALGICQRCDLAYCRECLIMEPPDFLCANCHHKELDLCAAQEVSLTTRGWGRRWGLLLALTMAVLVIAMWFWWCR